MVYWGRGFWCCCDCCDVGFVGGFVVRWSVLDPVYLGLTAESHLDLRGLYGSGCCPFLEHYSLNVTMRLGIVRTRRRLSSTSMHSDCVSLAMMENSERVSGGLMIQGLANVYI